MKKQMKLEHLKVNSFKTSLDKQTTQTVKGGNTLQILCPLPPQNGIAITTINPDTGGHMCWNPLNTLFCIDKPVQTDSCIILP